MRSSRQRWCSSIAALLVLACASCPARAGWRTFGLRDGLAHAAVQSVVEDSTGSLWFGTKYGATRYDGVLWRTFTSDSGLPSSDVRCMLADRTGQLWFGTSLGVGRFDGTRWETFAGAGFLPSNDVLAVFEDSAGCMWFGTASGLARFDRSTWSSSLPGVAVTAIAEDRAGHLWIGTQGAGAMRFVGASWVTYTAAGRTVPDNWITAIHVDRGGNVWLGTELGGVARFDGVGWATFEDGGGYFLRNVRAIGEDPHGNLWLGSESGLSRFDGALWKIYRSGPAGLVNNAVRALCFDASGNLWAGTDGGVSLYDRVAWSVLADAALGLTQVLSVFQDSTGAVWLGGSGGAARFTGGAPTIYGNAQGLRGASIRAIAADGRGGLWFGSESGASRFDGAAWTFVDGNSGLASSSVRSLLVDRGGRFWFGTDGGLTRLENGSWQSFTTANSNLAENHVFSLMEDTAGDIWIGTAGGVSVMDASGQWTTYRASPGKLAGDRVQALLEDRQHRIWFGTRNGLSMMDGPVWRTFTYSDGLAGDNIAALLEDSSGELWAAAIGNGVSRYDGTRWRTYTTDDSLPDPLVSAMIEERSGDLWFACATGGARHEPDRVPAQTVISPRPARVSPSPVQTLNFAAAFREVDGVQFSHALDGGGWSAWAAENFWIAGPLPDGAHELRVKARDALKQEDPTPAVASIEVDATPPSPTLSSPAFGDAVRDSLTVRGTADDARFRSFLVQVRPLGATTWSVPDAVTLGGDSKVVRDGVLAGWNTRGFDDGLYEMRLTVADTLGLTGSFSIPVQVDNEAPWANQTSPARVSAAVGGDVYTTHDEMHLYFPPHAFADDAVVTIDDVPASETPAQLPGGAIRVSAARRVTWGAATLDKPATLDLSLAGVAPSGTLAIYVSDDGATWRRLGGSVTQGRISLAFTAPGRYALFADGATPAGPGTLTALSLTPRVFSPQGRFASPQVAIGFTLGAPAAVTVKVFNRAGRLVRSLAAGEAMGAGANMVRWDGRDRDGSIVEDGLYLATVEAFGRTEVLRLAVVR